jgi:GGDEF domain-containing protein
VKPYSWDELLLRIQAVLELTRRHQGQRSFTGLPGSAVVEAEITRLMNNDEDFAFLSIDIDHFKRFNEAFGYERGDEVLSMLARILAAAQEDSEGVRFAGQLGGDDFVMLTNPDVAKQVAEKLTQEFDTESRGFFDPPDLERGYFEMVNRSGRREMVPLLALTIAVVENVRGRALHVRKLADLAAELRRFGKSRPGSIVVTERRH